MLSENEILKYAIENGIIDISTIQNTIEMNERQKYLDEHVYSVWQGKNGKYYTYLPDAKSNRGKKLVKRTTLESIQDEIVKFYKAQCEEPTIKSIFDSWVDDKLRYGEIQKQSYDKYQNNFKRFFGGISDNKIRYTTEESLEAFIKATITDQKLSQKAYSDMKIIINGIFKYAKKHGYTNLSITSFMGDLMLSKNAFTKIIRKKEDQIFLEEEIPRITKHLATQDDIRSLGLLLSFQTGLRVGELSALKRSDILSKKVKGIDEEKKYISVTKTEIKYRNVDGKWTHDVKEYPKSDAGVRNVILSEHAIDTVNRIIKINPFGEYLFEENRQRIKGNAFNRKLERVCNLLQINKKSTHKIRRTYGTTLIDNDVNDALIAEVMGHTDINTTKKYYYYSNKSEKTKAEQIERAVGNL